MPRISKAEMNKIKAQLIKKTKLGFSTEVFESQEFQDYVDRKPTKWDDEWDLAVGGYIGSSYRTRRRDQIVEKYLRDQGLGPNGIACWLTSTTARHLMDDVDHKTSEREFIKLVKQFTQRAFEDVTIWSHPDATGSLSDSVKLRERIFGKKRSA